MTYHNWKYIQKRSMNMSQKINENCNLGIIRCCFTSQLAQFNYNICRSYTTSRLKQSFPCLTQRNPATVESRV